MAMVIFLVLLLAVNAVFLFLNSFRCFNFYDMCIGIDGAWRILCGQRPYVDFIHFMGPVQIYVNAVFFKIFGLTKWAFWAQEVFVQSAVTVLIFTIARRYLNRIEVVLVTLLSTVCFYWPVSHPWHDVTAHTFFIIAVCFYLRHMPFVSRRQAFVNGSVLGACAVFAVLTKTNIGGACGLASLLIVFASPFPLAGFLGLCAGGLLGLFCAWPLVGDYVLFGRTVWENYKIFKGMRLNFWLEWRSWCVNYYWVTALVAAAGSLGCWRMIRPWLVLLGAVILVAVISINSGGIVHEANIFLWGTHILCALIVLTQAGYFLKKTGVASAVRRNNLMRRLIQAEAVILIIVSVWSSAGLKIWAYRGEGFLGEYDVQNVSGLQGWKFSKIFGPLMEDVVAYIQAEIPPEDSLLVMNDMTALYAFSGRESFKGMPISTLIPQIMPTPGEDVETVRRNLTRNPPDWVFTSVGDYMNVAPYLEFQDTLKNDYQIVKQWLNGYYVMMKRRDRP